MSLIVLSALAAAAAAPPPATVGRADDRQCPNGAVQLTKNPQGGNLFRRLDKSPPANAYKAVDHRIDGCQVPVVVRYDIGRR